MIRMLKATIVLFALVICFNSCKTSSTSNKSELLIKNPILPGYFADPSVVQYNGKFYIYVTVDPWGGDFLACWESENFVEWKFNKLNWPTKSECTSALSNSNMVWAPSVIQKSDKFYMYVSVGSEVWCGVANHPLGPWKNALEDKPMIAYDTTRYYHVIDAEVFVDDNRRSYLYWGSGWDWINGHCFAAELNDDMCTFKNQPIEVTPLNYFEAPHMLKHDSKYYLTYSDGKTIEDTYKVRYAVGDNPFGPFVEAVNSPILVTDSAKQVYGPGHHTITYLDGMPYILYHKHKLPFEMGTAYRQLCIDPLSFDDNANTMLKIYPSDTLYIPKMGNYNRKKAIEIVKVSSSSEESAYCKSKNVTDNNFQTLWRPNSSDSSAWIMFELKKKQSINNIDILFEYPWKAYKYKLEISVDAKNWRVIEAVNKDVYVGSPHTIELNKIDCKYIRLSVDSKAGIWEIAVN